MRKIKFRAWDKEKKWMILNVSHIQRDGLVVMQFTGLLDKNGKEIYEGDIVKYKSSYYLSEGRIYITEVKWSSERFTDGEMGYSLGIGFDIDWDEDENPEVIGNIYENPELLTQP